MRSPRGLGLMVMSLHGEAVPPDNERAGAPVPSPTPPPRQRHPGLCPRCSSRHYLMVGMRCLMSSLLKAHFTDKEAESQRPAWSAQSRGVQ